MNGCVFCSIVKGVAPASMVYADDRVMAFMDLQPVNSGHVLVIPKAHFAGLSELDPETGAHMFKAAMRVAEALRHSSIRCEGINLFLADGEVAFQDIFHVHLHVIPRCRDDGFGLKFGPNYGHKPTRRELDEVAEKIRAAMLQRG
jgi:histidine triad (HIT) family protein